MDALSRKALKAFSGVPAVEVWAPSTALILIDMQVSCIRPHGYTIRRLRERGLEEAVRQYEAQLATAIPNLRRVLERCRQGGQVVVHVHVVTLRAAGSTWPVQVTRWAPADSEESQIIEELRPAPGEVDLPKTCSGVFTGTNLDFLARRLGISAFMVGGVVTHGCVERAVMEGHDLGYGCVLLADGCASLTDELHTNALERMEDRRAHVLTTETLLQTDRLLPTLQARPHDFATHLS